MNQLEFEKQRKAEVKAARAWLRRHADELPPEEPSGGQVTDAEGRIVRRVVAVPEGFDDWEEVFAEAAKWKPLVGRPKDVDLPGAMLAKRVRHVLQFLRPEHQELLWEHYVVGRPVSAFSGTRQAVHERLGWARQAFLKAWQEHAEDDVVLTTEDL